MSFDSSDKDQTLPFRSSFWNFFKSHSRMISTMVVVVGALVSAVWALVIFFNEKHKEWQEQTLHITQEITVTAADPVNGKIPIMAQFKITNSGKSTAYILPGGFKAEGINFKQKDDALKADDFKTLLEKIEKRDRSLLYHDASLMDDAYIRDRTMIAGGSLFVGSTSMHYIKDDGTSLIFDPKEPARKFEHNESAQENFLFFINPGEYEYIIFVGVVPFVSQQNKIWSRIEFDIDNSFVNVIPCYATGRKQDQCGKDIHAEQEKGHDFLNKYTFTPVVTFKYISLKN